MRGEAYNENTENKIGYISRSGRSKTGLKIVGIWHNGKTYQHTVAEIVMVSFGVMSEKNCHMVVENINKNAADTKLQNLRLLSRNDLCKIEHIKKLISVKAILPYQYKTLDRKKIDIIRKYKRFGCCPTLIAELTNIKRATVAKYFYRSARMGGIR